MRAPGSWSAACPLRTSSRHCRSVRSPWRHSRNGTPGVTPTHAATAAALPGRSALWRRRPGRSAPPLARFTPAASTGAAVSAPSTRLPVLVQGSDAAHATRLLARSAGSLLPASVLTTARPPEEASTSSPPSLLSSSSSGRARANGVTAALTKHRHSRAGSSTSPRLLQRERGQNSHPTAGRVGATWLLSFRRSSRPQSLAALRACCIAPEAAAGDHRATWLLLARRGTLGRGGVGVRLHEWRARLSLRDRGGGSRICRELH